VPTEVFGDDQHRAIHLQHTSPLAGTIKRPQYTTPGGQLFVYCTVFKTRHGESMTTTQPYEPIGDVGEFLLNGPLYKTFALDPELKAISILCARKVDGHTIDKFDGFCPACHRDTTFTLSQVHVPSGIPWDSIQTRRSFDNVSLTCVRNDLHTIRFWVRIWRMTITKIGQYPSLADVAIEEVRSKYRSVLKGDNWSELYKAIGLAAHGEGIGSFVYLRRVLERLVRSRYEAFKDQEGWSDEEFNRRRMVEKIEYIGSHLPAYLVANRRIYSIFSVGVHELDNEKCLAFFEVGKRSIIMILQDDLQKQEELAARSELETAIAKFGPTTTQE
jgi:hypothetical protein